MERMSSRVMRCANPPNSSGPHLRAGGGSLYRNVGIISRVELPELLLHQGQAIDAGAVFVLAPLAETRLGEEIQSVVISLAGQAAGDLQGVEFLLGEQVQPEDRAIRSPGNSYQP